MKLTLSAILAAALLAGCSSIPDCQDAAVLTQLRAAIKIRAEVVPIVGKIASEQTVAARDAYRRQLVALSDVQVSQPRLVADFERTGIRSCEAAVNLDVRQLWSKAAQIAPGARPVSEPAPTIAYPTRYDIRSVGGAVQVVLTDAHDDTLLYVHLHPSLVNQLRTAYAQAADALAERVAPRG